MKFEMKFFVCKLKIQKFYFQLDVLCISFGEINGDVKFSVMGNLVVVMLGLVNGEVKILVNQGVISKFLLEVVGLNVGNVVISKLFGDKEVKFNCLVGDLLVCDGVMNVKILLLDIEDVLIVVDGSIDMKYEQLDLNVYLCSKGLCIILLCLLLYVKGSFKNLDVGVNKGVLVLCVGGVVVFGLLVLVMVILFFINIDGDQKVECGQLLDEVKKVLQVLLLGKFLLLKLMFKKQVVLKYYEKSWWVRG